MTSADSIRELSIPAPAIAFELQRQSELELEVVSLFEEFNTSLLRYTLSFGISMQDAEEIVQEVFLALFRHLQLGRSRKNLRGWIYRVAHNLALKQRYAVRKVRDQQTTAEETLERYLDPAPNPEDIVSSAQRRERLLAVVQAFPQEDRSCLYLRAEGLRYREIASVLGVSLGAVSISLTRSFARLQRADRR